MTANLDEPDHPSENTSTCPKCFDDGHVCSALALELIDFCLIFVPFDHDDEPIILRYAINSICPIGADGEHLEAVIMKPRCAQERVCRRFSCPPLSISPWPGNGRVRRGIDASAAGRCRCHQRQQRSFSESRTLVALFDWLKEPAAIRHPMHRRHGCAYFVFSFSRLDSPDDDRTPNFVPLTRHPTILDLSIPNIEHIASKCSESSFNIRP